jgi:DNA adenine methylase
MTNKQITLDTLLANSSDSIPFPRLVNHLGTAPLKCQGIKTELVRFILSGIGWRGDGRWIEPFLGSGVVLFNANPKRALATDSNKHIIGFYNALQSHKITPRIVRDFLQEESRLLEKGDAEYYYEVRNRFNTHGGILDFLFLSRACFNGVMRFNSKGEFNVPYNHKPKRFSKAYITKIVNQVDWVASVIEGKDWIFETADYKSTLRKCNDSDFVYADPPYPQRHNDYYNFWSDYDMCELSETLKRLACGFALSLWKENEFRKNILVENEWKDYPILEFSHRYQVGSFENFRHEIKEALIIKHGFESKRGE